MKATELMIGDWVKPYGSKDGINAKVTSIEPNRIGLITINGQPHHGTEDTLLPIPLTEEILEKNGFGFIDVSDSLSYQHGSAWTGWWIYKGVELGCCDNKKHPVYFNASDTNIEVKCVHQLQHVFRLCKIEKEIEL